jgi:phosphonate transport system substrate-binding protein
MSSSAETNRRTGDSQSLSSATTFLAPGLPLGLFDGICAYLGKHLDREISLSSDERNSGPMQGDADPFRAGLADLGFLCSPSFLYLRGLNAPSVRLVPAAFAFRGPQGQGQPVYFSEVVVHENHRASGFQDLAGQSWGFNDECSLSGYFSTLFKLSELGCDSDFFKHRVRTGSHHHSLEAILEGTIQGAAVDSTVLALWKKQHPDLATQLRTIDSWGPFPIQPIVIRDSLPIELSDQIADCLLNLGKTEEEHRWLASFGLDGFVPIAEDIYAEEQRTLIELGIIDPPMSPR